MQIFPISEQVVVRQLIVLVSCLWFVSVSQAQVCDGNLGENIFVDGDFGSGADNIVSPDPGIAPGFQYVFVGPPLDGEYTVTNNTGAWTGLWESWSEIGDNSPDPLGYMMVVNASFDPGLFYEQTIDGLCENTIYQFSADLINIIKPDAAVPHIKPNVTFLIDGNVSFTTGDIAQDLTWTTYAFTFSTNPGQTSVTLGLSNNAPGGIGNDIGLDNLSFRACGPNALILPFEQAVACEDGAPVELFATIAGDQFSDPAAQWQESFDQGVTWQDIPGANQLSFWHTNTSVGFYYYRYQLANGISNLASVNCRVVSNAKTVFVQPKSFAQTDTICLGGGLTIGARTHESSGVYVDTLTSSLGCDSIITTTLTVEMTSAIESQLTVEIPSCSYMEDGLIEATLPTGGTAPYAYTLNDEPIANGQLISGLAPGTYAYTIEDRFGCTLATEVSITAPPIYTIDLGPDLSIELGDDRRVRANASGGITKEIAWFPADVVDCSLPCTDAVVQPAKSIQLVGEAIDENGCNASDSLMLNVTTVRKHFFPTAFSPNGDGINDYFIGFGESPNVQMIEELLVVNRWGSMLFNESDILPNDVQSGWNGYFQGERLDPGVYVFSARVRYFDGEVEQVSGEVTLMR
ncbi:MAG: gliding motility-associated C-terminal domain-containing protein [Saprospiraceae bacterium]